MKMAKRVRVGLEDFLRVAVVEREQHDTAESAASALGLTVSSFKQRLAKERKAYPEIFKAVPAYQTAKGGAKRATPSEALAILERLQNSASK